MYVWRIEREGEGAWRSGLVDDCTTLSASTYKRKHHCNPGEMPGPWGGSETGTELHKKFGEPDCYHYHFGFKSLTQYKRAFKSIHLRRDMARHNGVLKRYKVDRQHVVLGNHQVAFKLNKAKHVADYSPDYV